MAETYPYENQLVNEPIYLFSIMLLQIAVAFILIFLAVLIFLKFRQNHKREVLHLALTFLFMGSSFASATVPIFLAFVAPSADIIWGIPIYGSFTFWWTNVCYLLMVISIPFLLRFSSMVFVKPQTKTLFTIAFVVFFVLVCIFSVWDVYQGIVVHTLDIAASSLPTVPWAILFLVIGVIPWVILMSSALGLHARIVTSVEKTGVLLIAFSALCTILSYAMFVMREFIEDPLLQDVMEVAYFGFFIFTAILLYIGYTLPAWFKTRVESKISASQKKTTKVEDSRKFT